LFILRRPPSPTLFPYTTLFRSLAVHPDLLGLLHRAQLSFGLDESYEGSAATSIGRACASLPSSAGLMPTTCRCDPAPAQTMACQDRKSTRLNSSHDQISYAVFC